MNEKHLPDKKFSFKFFFFLPLNLCICKKLKKFFFYVIESSGLSWRRLPPPLLFFFFFSHSFYLYIKNNFQVFCSIDLKSRIFLFFSNVKIIIVLKSFEGKGGEGGKSITRLRNTIRRIILFIVICRWFLPFSSNGSSTPFSKKN